MNHRNVPWPIWLGFGCAVAWSADSSASDSALTEQAPDPKWAAELLRFENPVLHDRARFADRLFLWEGCDAVGPGETFYAAPGGTRRLIWAGPLEAGQEWQALADANPLDTSRHSLRLGWGGEIGEAAEPVLSGTADPLRQPTSSRFLTPEGEWKWKVLPDLKLRAVLEQSGTGSDRTFQKRSQALQSEASASDLAWLGDRLPLRSQALASMSFRQRSGTLRAVYAQGTRWSLSPITGRSYAWNTRLTRLAADFDENSGLYLDLAQWKTPSALRKDQGEGSSSEMGLRLRGGQEGWAWHLQWAFERRTLNASQDSTTYGTLATLDDERFPLYFKAQKQTQFESHPEWEWTTDGVANTRSGLLSMEMNTALRRKEGNRRPEMGTSLYMAYRTRGTTTAQELGWDSLQGAMETVGNIHVPHAGRGAAVHARYQAQGKGWEASATSRFAAEWERPVFSGALLPVDTRSGGIPTRSGMYRASEHVLFNGSAQVQASVTDLPHTRLEAFAGWRRFDGAEADDLEYEPAPYWFGGQGLVELPLKAAAILQGQWVGTKWVRGWSPEPWRIRPHLEMQMGLRKRFLEEKVTASLQWLHALGETVLEHPAGNPLQSRILLGIEGRL
jgi:hypothetical protein